mgnify:CR=1 FL=1|jgi:hypothetical protein|nr:hypothetical protein [uncultured Mediterraneibacter sp.]
MKKRVYSDPSMEIVILNGEDIICASNTGENDVEAPPFSNNGTESQSLDYSDPVE